MSIVGSYDPDAASQLALALHRHLTHPETERAFYQRYRRIADGSCFIVLEIQKRSYPVDTELVRAFQAAAGIVDDGFYGRKTAGALGYWFETTGEAWVSRVNNKGYSYHDQWHRNGPAIPFDEQKDAPSEVLYNPPDDVRRLSYNEDRRRYKRAGVKWEAIHSKRTPFPPVSYEKEVYPFVGRSCFEQWPGALPSHLKLPPQPSIEVEFGYEGHPTPQGTMK